MRVMRQRQTPSRRHTGRAEALGINSDSRHRLSRCLEQLAGDHAFIPKVDPRNLDWKNKDQVEILRRQQVIDAGSTQSRAASH